MPTWTRASVMNRRASIPAVRSASLPAVRAVSLVKHALRRHVPALIGTLVLLVIVLACLTVPWLSPYDSERSNMRERYQPPSWAHPMGTDDLGRDLLTRVLYGGRISLAVGVIATLAGVGLGILLGALAGLWGGWIDNVMMRLTDMFLALPRIFVLILMSVFLRSLNADWGRLGGGVPGIVIVLALLSWMGVARLVRGQLLVLRERDYVTAARGLGLRSATIAWRHLLPNALTPVIVAASLRVAGAIMAESGLSFLGFGVQPPTPTWGNLLTHGQAEMLKGHLWLVVFPGLMIFLTVIAVHFLGDALRDFLDPRPPV